MRGEERILFCFVLFCFIAVAVEVEVWAYGFWTWRGSLIQRTMSKQMPGTW